MVVSDDHRTVLLDVTLTTPLIMEPKGRITLPTRLVNALKERSLVWVPYKNHLRAYLPSTWKESVVTPLLAEDTWDEALTEKHRRRLALADDIHVDEHGRCSLSPLLRQKAGLARECVLVSMLDRLELWDAERWQAWVDLE